MTAKASAPVEIKCPACGRFLAEVEYAGRSICTQCGWEVAVRSPEARRAERTRPYPLGG